MSFSVTEPTKGTKWFAGVFVALATPVITLVPLLWIVATGFKSPADSIAYPPVVVFEPTLGRLREPVHRTHPCDTRHA